MVETEKAFPVGNLEMDLIDYFAAAALQGFMAYNGGGLYPERFAKTAYTYAAAMMEERKTVSRT